MSSKQNIFLLFFSFFICSNITAQNESADSLSWLEKNLGFGIKGAVDAYYQYNFNHHPHPVNFVESHNSFSPGMANIILSKEGKIGFTADLAFGPRSENIIGYSGNSLSLIKQLFVTYQPHEKVRFTLGSFGTFIGYELIEATGNLNYSSSYQFNNGPFYQSGLKINFALTEKINWMVGVFNDTDRHIDEVSGKHFGSQLAYNDERISIALNYLRGKEDDSDPLNEITGNQVDVTASLNFSDAFGMGLNTTVKKLSAEQSGEANWFGAAIYANYQFNRLFTLALRAEHIRDNDGIITDIENTNINAFTISGNFHFGALRFIPEFRVDAASNDVFIDQDNIQTGVNSAIVFGVVYEF